MNFSKIDSPHFSREIADEFPEARGHCLTTPMHTDRQELIGYDAEVICGG